VFAKAADPPGLKDYDVQWTTRAAPAACTPLTDRNGEDTSPAWSPDQTLIAFSSNRTVNHEIFTMRSNDGAFPTNRTNNLSEEITPDWQKTRARPDALIKKASPATDPEVGDDRFFSIRTTAQPQVKAANVARGSSTTFFVRAQKEFGASETFKVLGTGSDARFVVAYFAGITNVTGQVVAGTFSLPVTTGAVGRLLRVVVTARSTAPRLSTKSAFVTLTSTVNAADKDTVRASVAAI
jgi:hypothetical protein